MLLTYEYSHCSYSNGKNGDTWKVMKLLIQSIIWFKMIKNLIKLNLPLYFTSLMILFTMYVYWNQWKKNRKTMSNYNEKNNSFFIYFYICYNKLMVSISYFFFFQSYRTFLIIFYRIIWRVLFSGKACYLPSQQSVHFLIINILHPLFESKYFQKRLMNYKCLWHHFKY